MHNLAAVVRRAAQRVPGAVAERSLAQAQTVMARICRTEAIPLPELTPRLGPLRVAPGERWCGKCGETINEHGTCPRCGSHRGLGVSTVLRPDEFYIAG